ncbi:MAG: bifunctional phosphopantothenoylcysteine decarboxylase/phosphopantothenate--cysteine ligase CoaBC [Bacteroidetes bacterium]|nr:bifunctional phosphopantothenoylcysteine decarboxylase/phosphopantothenate--cysteine ligase CoaBC [Bacteroidota bacterium]
MLSGKNILLGITGSIAAYKSAFLTRLLVKAGANVKVVMTSAAKEFITPLTLSTLSRNPVYSQFTSGDQGEWNNHVELALWADYMLIAPATADVIAKMANGICDNLLLAVYLSAKCEVLAAPAMDVDMFQHPATKENLVKIKSFGDIIISPDNGELASGLVGEGRMVEPEAIVQFLSDYIKKKSPLNGKKALVTAGPTYEAIDPVRFIGNYSSGKMGFSVAEELANQGAEVALICGPNTLSVKNNSIKRIDVISSDEMYEECMKQSKYSDIIVMSAAVADFKPNKNEKLKIKKEKGLAEIKLVHTRDILSELGKRKKGNMLVGFALETENEIQNAKKKLHNKNLDFIVLNSLKDSGSGFGFDTNKITIVDKKYEKQFKLMSKKDAAKNIVNEIIKKMK